MRILIKLLIFNNFTMNNKNNTFSIKITMFSFLISLLLVSITYWAIDWARTCETIYTDINWSKYFSSLLCTENIRLTWVVADNIILRDVSTRTISDFIVANYWEITKHIDSWSWNTCDNLDEVSAN